jgi:hypothetical protein
MGASEGTDDHEVNEAEDEDAVDEDAVDEAPRARKRGVGDGKMKRDAAEAGDR